MPPLSPTEARVLGALVEKQIATPDYYPLSLNALVNACNQKNHRDPVVAYEESTVLRALESLRLKNLAFIFAGAAERVRKYGHTFPKALALDPAETALLCVLLLRGPQTPGELRSRTQHLHNFPTLAALEETLDRLCNRTETSASEVSPSEALAKEGTPATRVPLVKKLPRAPGTKESRYTQLLTGEPPLEISPDHPDPHLAATTAVAPPDGTAAAPDAPSQVSKPADFDPTKPDKTSTKEDEASPKKNLVSTDQDRVTNLESEIAQLRHQLADLQSQFATFRKQFE